jgi:hypothetical protein
MRIDFKGYTPKQYAVLIMRQDLKYSIREISERLGYSQSGVKSIFCDGLICGIENPKVKPEQYYKQIWGGCEK